MILISPALTQELRTNLSQLGNEEALADEELDG